MAGPVLVYDGDCGFCTTTVRWWERRSRTAPTVVAWQMADLERLGLDAERCQESVQWVGADGDVSEGADAVAAALVAGGGFWVPVGRIMAWPGIIHLARYVYRLVARNRHRLPGATGSCALGGRT
jgi:predicted DCC family thiol-disulfide oxidoreductase YuxK